MKRIRSTPLNLKGYAILKSDPPEGCCIARRKSETGYRIIEEDWPEVAIGEEIEIETMNHWIWRATVEEVRDADNWLVRIVGEKQAMPLPPVIEGKPYALPFMSGDAWSTRPEAGRMLQIDGRTYRVTGKPKARGVGAYVYQLAEVSAEAYVKRPGRVAIKDLTDPNESSHRYYGHNVGRIIQIGDEYLHVEKVQRAPYGDAEGQEVFGYATFGVGHFVPAAKAAKLKAAWDAKERVRSLEMDLRVAKQDPDYGGNPEAVSRIEAELAEARKAVRK